jgi:cobalt-zinc-cadmium efflux system outer membrane protein
MDRRLITVLLTLGLMWNLHGCASSPSRKVARTRQDSSLASCNETQGKTVTSALHERANQISISDRRPVRQISNQDEASELLPHSHTEQPSSVIPAEENATMTLQHLEAIAMSNNPTLVQANAQLQAEQGAAYQAGLWFNPVVGYTSEQIGVNGTAGETQGGYVSQEIVTGGKLRLSRAKWAQRAQIAATNSLAQQQRVLNDVQTQFYSTVAVQRLVDIRQRLVSNGEDNVETRKEMLNLGQTTASDVLQAEVELRRDQLNLKDAENELQQEWRKLTALVGCPRLAVTKLEDVLTQAGEPLEYDEALGRLIGSSPEVIAAQQKNTHDQLQLERERVQPIPNVLIDARVGRNFEAGGQTTTGVNVGLPIPFFDRNQGTIQQAEADLARSHAESQRLELELQTRLASEYRAYLSAWQRVQEYQATMLPKAKESTELLRQSYNQRRAPWIDVLAADRFLMTLESEYVDSLQAYHSADVMIRGMMLTGGLTEAPPPLGSGHIDATPKPR